MGNSVRTINMRNLHFRLKWNGEIKQTLLDAREGLVTIPNVDKSNLAIRSMGEINKQVLDATIMIARVRVPRVIPGDVQSLADVNILPNILRDHGMNEEMASIVEYAHRYVFFLCEAVRKDIEQRAREIIYNCNAVIPRKSAPIDFKDWISKHIVICKDSRVELAVLWTFYQSHVWQQTEILVFCAWVRNCGFKISSDLDKIYIKDIRIQWAA